MGALDFLEKPVSHGQASVTVENALKLTRLEDENRRCGSELVETNSSGSPQSWNA